MLQESRHIMNQLILLHIEACKTVAVLSDTSSSIRSGWCYRDSYNRKCGLTVLVPGNLPISVNIFWVGTGRFPIASAAKFCKKPPLRFGGASGYRVVVTNVPQYNHPRY